MGILYFRRDEGPSRPPVDPNSQPQDGEKSTSTVLTDPWLIVVIVIGVAILAALGVCLLTHYIKLWHKRRRGFQPVKETGFYSHKRISGSGDGHEVSEHERRLMIEKSMASRMSLAVSSPSSRGPLSSSSSPPLSTSSSNQGYHPEVPLMEPNETTSLRDDYNYKAWEANIQNERMASHPGGVGLDQHPAFASHLSVPQPTRSAVPSRLAGSPPRI
ncbi:hypothetical protein F4777DRAFT_483963 [Nemania sp. FL0916]|nr:hypothetical protein F4777DRAFT_483963 [Nemania sp. FL0916]